MSLQGETFINTDMNLYLISLIFFILLTVSKVSFNF